MLVHVGLSTNEDISRSLVVMITIQLFPMIEQLLCMCYGTHYEVLISVTGTTEFSERN